MQHNKFWTVSDCYYMHLALLLAKQGAELGEVPVGAVLVEYDEADNDHNSNSNSNSNSKSSYSNNLLKTAHLDSIDFSKLVKPQQLKGNILGQGYNRPIINHDPTAHAEISALRCACEHIANYRLPKRSTLYVTLEPCTMCVGALIHARLNRLVFATHEPKAGMVGSQSNLLTADFYNHNISVQSGLLADKSRAMLQQFFKERRALKKAEKQAKQRAKTSILTLHHF